MKTVKFLKDIDNRIIVDMELKKNFEHKGFNFAICIEPDAKHKWYTLINFENGGKLPMHLATNKTIKDFHAKSINSIDALINRIGLDNFKKVINSHPKINQNESNKINFRKQ